ncbi:MAG TPA: FmdB family transcriptional regulator [Candidatus Omnitrophica bacterium]|nr:FmdB family transcriptional regulator [Candidatus Omnitrophota bacterium]HCI44146.1 FmdB family transcriptional regulator [Candidatus Omnitrophota bacterium]
MPTYQYECGACGHGFEALQSMADKKLKKCPKCGKPKLHRLIGTGSGIIFRGTGFYETDYKRKSDPKAAKADSRPSASAKESSACCGGGACGH